MIYFSSLHYIISDTFIKFSSTTVVHVTYLFVAYETLHRNIPNINRKKFNFVRYDWKTNRFVILEDVCQTKFCPTHFRNVTVSEKDSNKIHFWGIEIEIYLSIENITIFTQLRCHVVWRSGRWYPVLPNVCQKFLTIATFVFFRYFNGTKYQMWSYSVYRWRLWFYKRPMCFYGNVEFILAVFQYLLVCVKR